MDSGKTLKAQGAECEMSRSLPEWIGKRDGDPVPPRVRMRVFERFNGRCHKCTRSIRPGEPWTCEHLSALINAGQNREGNLGITCCNCLPLKNAADVAEKSQIYRKKSKHLGLRKSSRPVPGSRNTPWKKKMSGEVVKR